MFRITMCCCYMRKLERSPLNLKLRGSVQLNLPEELLPLQLVQLRDDVVEGPLDPGDDDVLDGVDAPVRDLDHLVERDERRLQRRQLHEQFHGASVVLLENLRVENDFKLTLCFLPPRQFN